MKSKLLRALPLALILTLLATTAFAQDGDVSANELAYAIDNITLLFAAVLVIFMQAGFAMVESGFNSAKNTVNIMFKNFIDLAAGVVLFWLVGYSLMYGAPLIAGFVGFSGFGISQIPPEALPGNLNPQVDWLFQVAFAATAATIVSGAVAGRMKFAGYLVYSVVISAVIYPISGFWVWGGGWLSAMGFHDFAGSLVVHSLGVVLYRMVAGRKPFYGSRSEVLNAHLHQPPPRPSKFRWISPALEAVILKALAKDPADRYQSGARFAQALAQVELAPTPARPEITQRLFSWLKPRR
jgi:hypothetical protein